jgi:hypothetical protein
MAEWWSNPLSIVSFVAIIGILVLVAIQLLGDKGESAGGGGGGGGDTTLLQQAILANQESIAQSLEIAATANQAATAANQAATAAQTSADNANVQYGSLQAFTVGVDTKADQALSSANLGSQAAADALSSANLAAQDATDALSSASLAAQDAADALSSANLANQAAAGADSRAVGAQSVADQALGTASRAIQNKGFIGMTINANFTASTSNIFIPWDAAIQQERAAMVTTYSGDMESEGLDLVYSTDRNAFILRTDRIYQLEVFLRVNTNQNTSFGLYDRVAGALVTGASYFQTLTGKYTGAASHQGSMKYIIKGDALQVNADGYAEVNIGWQAGNTAQIVGNHSKCFVTLVGESGFGIGV